MQDFNLLVLLLDDALKQSNLLSLKLAIVFVLGGAHDGSSFWAWGVGIEQASGHAPVNHLLR